MKKLSKEQKETDQWMKAIEQLGGLIKELMDKCFEPKSEDDLAKYKLKFDTELALQQQKIHLAEREHEWAFQEKHIKWQRDKEKIAEKIIAIRSLADEINNILSS